MKNKISVLANLMFIFGIVLIYDDNYDDNFFNKKDVKLKSPEKFRSWITKHVTKLSKKQTLYKMILEKFVY